VLSGIHTEMFFQMRAENFGPLVEKVFPFVGDDDSDTGMSAFRLITSALAPEADVPVTSLDFRF
jgi:hypothetical protein